MKRLLIFAGLLLAAGPTEVVWKLDNLEHAPQAAGQCSIGTRFNRRDYFKGAILLSRMTTRALRPEEFLKVPDQGMGR